MRTRLIATVVAGAVAVTLSACSKSTNKAAAVENRPTSGVDVSKANTDLGLGNPSAAMCNGKHYTIGYDVFSDTQEFAAAMTQNMKDVASKLGCVDIVVLSDNADAATALSNVKTFVQRKVDGVVLFQVIASAQAGIMNTLNAAKIPAVAVAVPAPGTPFLSISDLDSGKMAGEHLADVVLSKGQDKNAVALVGAFPAGGQSTIDRATGVTAGIRSKIADFPNSRVITVDGGATADSGYQAVTNVLSKLPSGAPIMVTGVNDDVISGMVRALQTAGRTTNVYTAGMGVVSPSGAKYVCNSPLYVGGVGFFPETWGTYVIPAILDQMQGKSLPSATYIPEKWMEASDVKSTYPSACS